MLPAHDIIAHVELDESMLSYFLPQEYGPCFVPSYNDWVQIIISIGNPLEAYVIQGNVIFYHPKSTKIIETQDTICVRVEDIIFIYQHIGGITCQPKLSL